MEPETFSDSARAVLASRFRVADYSGAPVPDAEVLIAGLNYRINADLLESFPRIKLIATTTTGLNHVDIALLERRGITLVSLRDVRDAIQNVSATAELAIALVFALGRRVVQSSRSIENQGAWDRMKFFTGELREQQLGIIGYGRIGSKVAGMSQALGLRVAAFDCDRLVPKSLRRESLAQILQESTIISIHADYRGSQIIGKSELDLCRDGAMIVNTARGELIDEPAVAESIRSGALGGFAADVLAGENIEGWEVDKDHLTALARQGHNVILTPHLGGCTREAFEVTQLAIANHLSKVVLQGI